MKFQIDRTPLLDALSKTQSVVEKKNTIQILSNILFTVKGNHLSVSATDLEVGVKILLNVENAKDGKITLPAKQLFDIVKELPDQKLTLTLKENQWVEILCGKSRFNIVSLSAEEYPSLPNFEDKEYFETRKMDFAAMVDKTAFAVSTDATRYHLNGVYLENVGNNQMRMTATDGHRLSFVDAELFKSAPELKRGLIIPKKGLNELRKLLGESSNEVFGIAFERGYLFGKTKNVFLFVRLIEGEYPDYRTVIPQGVDKSVTLQKDEFYSALKRVSLLAHEKSRAVKLSFSSGMLVISSNNPDMGEAREELEISYSQDTMDIGFNAKYMMDCLAVIDQPKLELQFKDKLSPGIMSSSGAKNHTYVIMPMRI